MTVPLALIRNDDQDKHESAGHPERPDRVRAILDGIAADPVLAALPWLEAPAADARLPQLVHSEDEMRRVEGLSVKGGGWFDPDTYCTDDVVHRCAERRSLRRTRSATL